MQCLRGAFYHRSLLGTDSGSGQIAVVWWGIRSMMRSAEMGEREHERRHRETMQDMKDRHEDAMHKHDETAQAAGERHEEAMRTLDALIARTAPHLGKISPSLTRSFKAR